MPEKSGFFDSTADDMREYPARDFAEYFARFVTNGVFNGGQYLNPTASGQDANISLSPGAAWINGYAYSVYDSPLVLPIELAAALDRIDRIILRLDTSTPVRAIRALVVQGLPASNPTPPALVRSGNIYDLSIAQVRVPANSTIITQANIMDERLNQDVCGLVNSLIRVDTATFQAQWEAFMQEIQNQGFATTSYVDNRVLTGGFGTTTNSGNAYSVNINPAPAVLIAGLRITVKINAANTGAATINVNGLGAKSILKSNGNALASGNMKANSVYTLVYSGSAFILQGEGGEYGNALASEVRLGKTIGTESGLVTGTFAVAAGDYPRDVSIFGVAGLLERLTTDDKTSIAAQITNKGIPANVSDSPANLATKIGQIVTPKDPALIKFALQNLRRDSLVNGKPYLDSSGNLWAGFGVNSTAAIRVYDPNGTILQSVSITGLTGATGFLLGRWIIFPGGALYSASSTQIRLYSLGGTLLGTYTTYNNIRVSDASYNPSRGLLYVQDNSIVNSSGTIVAYGQYFSNATGTYAGYFIDENTVIAGNSVPNLFKYEGGSWQAYSPAATSDDATVIAALIATLTYR